VIAAGIIAVVSTHNGNSAAGQDSGRRVGSGHTSTGASSTGTFALPPDLASQAAIPVGNGQVLSVGSTIALLAGNGRALWNQNASVSSPNDDTATNGGPQVSRGCAVVGDVADHEDDFISLDSGQQTVVTEGSPAAGDSFALVGNRVALPDGTIRNPCTGAVTGRAAPDKTFTNVECMIGSTVIGSGSSGQMAWQNGHRLWQIRTSNPVICDTRGSVVMLDANTGKISYIDPGNGQARWTVKDPTCAGGCLSHSPSPVHLFGSGKALVLTDSNQVLALARSNGSPLWHKSNACALVARVTPVPGVLIGSCTGLPGGTGAASVVNPFSGATIATYQAAVSGCTGDSDWTANAHQLLVVCPGPSSGGATGQANLIDW
jgi:outer membrane protein assembly factor BamB